MDFTYSRNVYLEDTDAAGVVYFAKALSICHEAYEAALLSHNISLVSWLKKDAIAIPVIHGEIDFFSPIYWQNQLNIYVSPQQLSENEFAITYKIVIESSPPSAIAKTRHVSINSVTRRRIALPEKVREWIN